MLVNIKMNRTVRGADEMGLSLMFDCNSSRRRNKASCFVYVT